MQEADKKLMAENEKRYKTIAPCAQEQRKLVSVTIPLFKDVGLTQPSGEIRIKLVSEPDEVTPIEFRLSSTDKWEIFRGDFIPAGEWGYAYQTVLEKRGDKILLPRKPFSSPVWFDFKKAFKTRLGETDKSLELMFVFDQKRPSVYSLPGMENSVVPLRIEGDDGIVIEDPGNIRPDGTMWDDDLIKKVIKKGKQKKIPIRNFFDKDEHIAASSQMGC